jgi:mono/diheme cytochrome c family protein
MRKALRWLGYVVGALLALLLLAAGWVWFASSQKLNARVAPRPERLTAATPAALADIERRARTLGCISCHGEGLRGKVFFDSAAFARMHAPNLTQVAATASDQQLAQGIRQGIGADGRSLLVMPSEAYQHLNDAETSALIAYIRRLPRAGQPSPPRKVGPIGRFVLASSGFPTSPALSAEYRKRPAVDLGAGHALGRYLALTTCSSCHGSDFGGRRVSPEIDAPNLDIAGAYDLPAFTRLLREGAAPGGKPVKEMSRIAREDSRFYSDEEIAALHGYLVARAQR